MYQITDHWSLVCLTYNCTGNSDLAIAGQDEYACMYMALGYNYRNNNRNNKQSHTYFLIHPQIVEDENVHCCLAALSFFNLLPKFSIFETPSTRFTVLGLFFQAH